MPLLAAWVDAGRGQTDKVGKELAAMGNARGLGPLKLLHETLIADVTDQTAKADAGYRKLVAVETPPTLRVAQLAGNFYERHGEADAARALYQSVAASDDSDVAASGLARLGQGAKPDRVVASPADGAAEAMFDLASLLNERETLDAGLVYARLALDLKPDFTLAQLLAGEMREAQEFHGLSDRDALEMATLHGARALGQTGRIGQISIGRRLTANVAHQRITR